MKLQFTPEAVPNAAPACFLQVAAAYKLLDSFQHGSVDGQPSVSALMEEAVQLRKQQDLSELYVSDYVFLQRCRVGAGNTRMLEPRGGAGWAHLGQICCTAAMGGVPTWPHHTPGLPYEWLQEELGCLKSLWDTAAAVLHTFQAWSGMPWGGINVDALQEVGCLLLAF